MLRSPLLLALLAAGVPFAGTVSFAGSIAEIFAAPAMTTAQDDSAASKLQEKITTFLKHARRASAVIRPQAADRLVGIGEPAAKRILEVAGENNQQLALLGTSLIEVFGSFGDSASGTQLRQRLWPALQDAEFPWRPAAVRGLAVAPQADEKQRFIAYLEDPIAPVRLGALKALSALTQDAEGAVRADFLAHAKARLSDESDFVRREAAVQLFRRGHADALLWLLEDMKRDDSFFGNQFGRMARWESMRALSGCKIDLGQYNPDLPPNTPLNRDGLAALALKLNALAKASKEQLPEAERDLLAGGPAPIAQAAAPILNAVIGLQLKSCRRGDYHLRWTTDDTLIVGFGNPLRIQLPKGTTAALVAAGKVAQAPLEGKVFWGRAGCDIEGYFLPRADATIAGPLQLILAKNEEPTQGLRPGALTKFGAALAASIPSTESMSQADSRTQRLASRVRAAFASIGGAVSQ